MRKGSGLGILVLLAIVLLTGGFAAFGETISKLAVGAWEMIKWLISLAVKFPSELGITDWVNTKVLYFIIMVIAAGLGIFITARTKHKVYVICGGIIGFISLILTLSA